MGRCYRAFALLGRERLLAAGGGGGGVTEPFEHEGSNTRRLDRVESDVSSLTSAVGELRGDVRSFGQILARIENSIASNEGREERARLARQPNALAYASAIFGLFSASIGGAWLIGGQLSRLDERDIQRDRQLLHIERDIDQLQKRGGTT